MAISKLRTYLLVDVCKSQEKLNELLIIRGLCQALEHLLYGGLLLQSATVWI